MAANESNIAVGEQILLRGTGGFWGDRIYPATVVQISEDDDTVKVQYYDGGFKRFTRAELLQLQRTDPSVSPEGPVRALLEQVVQEGKELHEVPWLYCYVLVPKFLRGPLTGLCVGITDVALVFPLAVLATRRENGLSLMASVRMGQFHSGALTAGTLLLPYSMLVETLTSTIRESVQTENMGGTEAAMMAAVITGIVAAVGTQPIEKKLVLDACLEKVAGAKPAVAPTSPNWSLSSQISEPFRAIRNYQQLNGWKALWLAGLAPLLGREVTYVMSTTAIGPYVSKNIMDRGHGTLYGLAGCFTIGAAAGIFSAPFQTLNVMCKSEENRGQTIPQLMRNKIFNQGFAKGMQRLYYGSMIRSARCGCATSLYFVYRMVFAPPKQAFYY